MPVLTGRSEPMLPDRQQARQEWPALLLPLLALLVVLPLLRFGPSCGHDFGFHMQSWMDASAQIRHGDLLPRWAYSPAFNAGEPRFIFYPPLSWLLGSVLLLTIPANLAPAAFTWLALILAGIGMYALGRSFASPLGALLASAVYLVNPYLLFTAFERTAFAELLAAAWLPWLLRAALAERPSTVSVALPLALLWLTNAPAAVMGTYMLAFAVLLRIAWQTFAARRRGTTLRGSFPAVWPLVRAGGGGLCLGLALPGFYLLPAAWERRYVQIAMAIIPNMRVEDNFLFGHTGYGPHDAVLHTASLVAVGTLALAALALTLSALRLRSRHPGLRVRWAVLTCLTAAVAVLMLPVALPAWHHLPELAFLQFPWRWLAVLGCCFGTAVALAIGRRRVPAVPGIAACALLTSLCGPLALGPFRQGCEAHELPAERVGLFAAHHGVGPTDEYTPGDADNDQLRWDDPAWWLASDANAPGPGTVPNPAATIVDYDQPPPLEQTVSGRAPEVLRLQLKHPEDLVLNLRDYPAWDVRVNGRPATHLERDDGLLAIALPAGPSETTVRWRRLPDAWIGDGVSLAAAIVAVGLLRRSRRIRV